MKQLKRKLIAIITLIAFMLSDFSMGISARAAQPSGESSVSAVAIESVSVSPEFAQLESRFISFPLMGEEKGEGADHF